MLLCSGLGSRRRWLRVSSVCCGRRCSPAVDRALLAAVVVCVFGGAAVLLVHERWWMLAALQGVVYLVTAPFTGGMLRVWTVICVVNFTALVSIGWPA